jgi:hypothetical protein
MATNVFLPVLWCSIMAKPKKKKKDIVLIGDTLKKTGQQVPSYY